MGKIYQFRLPEGNFSTKRRIMNFLQFEGYTLAAYCETYDPKLCSNSLWTGLYFSKETKLPYFCFFNGNNSVPTKISKNKFREILYEYEWEIVIDHLEFLRLAI